MEGIKNINENTFSKKEELRKKIKQLILIGVIALSLTTVPNNTAKASDRPSPSEIKNATFVYYSDFDVGDGEYYEEAEIYSEEGVDEKRIEINMEIIKALFVDVIFFGVEVVVIIITIIVLYIISKVGFDDIAFLMGDQNDDLD